MLAVVAKIKVKAGKTEEAVQALKAALPDVKKEKGTLYYTVNRDRTDPNLIVVIEKYRDDAAFQAHSSSPHLARLFEKTAPLMEGNLELIMMDEIASI